MRADWRWLSAQGSSDHAALIMGEADRAGMLADRALTIAALAVTLVILLLTALLIAPSLAGMMLAAGRSEEHTSELQSLMRISYAVFCLKKIHKYIST